MIALWLHMSTSNIPAPVVWTLEIRPALKLGVAVDAGSKYVGFVLQTAKGDIDITTEQASVLLAMAKVAVA